MSVSTRSSGLVRGPSAAIAVWGGYLLGGPWFAVAAALVAFFVAGEMFARARTAGLKPLVPLGLAAIAVLTIVGHVKADRVSRALVGVVSAFVIATFGEMLVRTDRTKLIETVLSSLVPAVFVAVPASYLAAMRQMPEGDRLVGALLIMVTFAEIAARALTRITGTGIGGAAAGPSRASAVRLIGATAGAFAGGVVALGIFEPTISTQAAMSLAAVTGIAVGVSQPIATLLESVAAPGIVSDPLSVTRATAGLWLAAPFSFYVFLLLAR